MQQKFLSGIVPSNTLACRQSPEGEKVWTVLDEFGLKLIFRRSYSDEFR